MWVYHITFLYICLQSAFNPVRSSDLHLLVPVLPVSPYQSLCSWRTEHCCAAAVLRHIAGPLVVGLTLSAIAVGAAFSAGALAFTTLILPMLLLMGVGGLASFGLFAGLGAMFVLPKLVFSAFSLVSSRNSL